MRGSVTLEATLSLTLLILVGFTLILMSHFLYAGEVLDQALFDTADTANFALSPLSGPVNRLALQVRLEHSLKQNLKEKGFEAGRVTLKLMDLGEGAYTLTAVCSQPTPLLGTLVVEKNYHVLNAGFTLMKSDQKVWVTDKGVRYHEAGCHTLRKSQTVHALEMGEAVEKGYTPCKICIGHTLFGKPQGE